MPAFAGGVDAAGLLDLLKERHLKLTCAESFTGGLFAAGLAGIVGASDAFVGGVVSYTDDVKADILGVDRGTLKEKGAVSEEVAREMAEGARRRLRADVAVSFTGFAGPNVPEGVPASQAGLFFVGVATARGTRVERFHVKGEPPERIREATRERGVKEGLRLVAEAIREGR